MLCVEFWEVVLSRVIIANRISQGSGLIYSACWTLVTCNYFSSLIDAFKTQKKDRQGRGFWVPLIPKCWGFVVVLSDVSLSICPVGK